MQTICHLWLQLVEWVLLFFFMDAFGVQEEET